MLNRITFKKSHLICGLLLTLAPPVFAVDATEVQKLVASDAATLDRFGAAVAVDGDTALIGAIGNSDVGLNSGAAYIFVRKDGVWSEQAKLTASDGAGRKRFGYSVSLEGDTALIGAPADDGIKVGSAYVFTRSGTTWSEQAKLIASDGEASDQFGFSVDVDGDTALVGASYDDFVAGSAYVYTRSGTVWSEQAKLTASDRLARDWFGFSVSLDGDTALIGANHEGNPNVNSGAVYVFTRSGTAWTQRQKLKANDGSAGDEFGSSVSVNGTTALIGAPNADFGGAAYIFTRAATDWAQLQKLTANDARSTDAFGYSVSLDGDRALIGDVFNDAESRDSGAAYLFARGGNVWTQLLKLVASDDLADDWLGSGVSIDGNTALVGAPLTDDKGDISGSTYLFDLPAYPGNTEVVIPEHYTTLRPDQVYEAESWAAGTGFVFRSNQAGYSHTGFADFTEEGFIEWTVYVPRTSEYEIVFRYALGRGARALEISVDGEVVDPSLNFTQSGPWKDWSVWTELGTTTRLSAGVHVVRATTTGRNGPNIDYLRLDDVGSPQFQDRVPDDSRGFGRGLTVVGDVNDDGVPDIAIGAPQTQILNDGFSRGRVTLHSGSDGSLIDIINPNNYNFVRSLGRRLAALGDVNNDGVDDFVALATDPFFSGLFYMYSGADRSILRSYSGDIQSAAAIGDIDGDSVSEIVLGAPRAVRTSSGQALGRVYIVSGARNATLLLLNNPSPHPTASQGLGEAVTGIGDIDGDNVPDFLASAPRQVVDGLAEGQVFAFSGATGNLIYAVNNPGANELPALGRSGFGRVVERLKDITGDSIDDFIVPVEFNTVDGLERAGQAFIFSGADGSLFRTIQSPTPEAQQQFGSRAAGLPDLNNDGVPEYAVVHNRNRLSGTPDDVWYFYSGLDGSLLLIMEVGLELSQIETLGDLDGNGSVELAIAGTNSAGGAVHIYSFGSASDPSPPSDADVVTVRSKPFWNVKNTVDLTTERGLWVAIMSKHGFDPVTVDVGSVVLGNNAAAPRGIESGDRNNDGVPDLILRYKLKDLSLACGEQELNVSGMTNDGTEFEGDLKLNVVGCSP